MVTTNVSLFGATYQKTHEWLKELVEQGHFADEAQAYSGLRAVLHALRDRLTVDEAAHLAAQLPALVRGFYYEGWKPSSVPHKQRDREQFLGAVRHELRNDANIEPEAAAHAVFALLSRKVTAGEIENIKDMMPETIRTLWP